MEKQDKTTQGSRPRLGRPPKPAEKVKTKWVGFAATPSEHDQIAEDARAAGRSRSAHLRHALGLSTD